MIKQLIKRLGLDRVEDYLTEEMRRVKIEVLQEERNVVKSLLERIEDRIASLDGRKRGPKAAGKKRGPGRPKGSKSRAPRTRKPGQALRDYVRKALEKAGAPVNAAELGARVKELGYKSVASSNSMLTSIYKVLADNALYKKVEAGVYELKKKAAGKAEKE